jgi:hypothetical protein
MTVACESEVRMALRHVPTGWRCIMRPVGVIAILRGKGLPRNKLKPSSLCAFLPEHLGR